MSMIQLGMKLGYNTTRTINQQLSYKLSIIIYNIYIHINIYIYTYIYIHIIDRYGMVWYGMVWYGVISYHMMWYDMGSVKDMDWQMKHALISKKDED